MAGNGARPVSTVALCAAAQGVGGGLGWSLVPPLMPQIARDLELSHTMGGVVWGAASLGIALASPVGGAAVDRFGPRIVAGAAMLVGALACLARMVVDTPWELALAMFAFGLHIGFAGPAVPKALAAHVPLSHLGRANGIATVAYTLATAATVWLAPTWLAPALGGWRPAMGLAAGAMVVVGVLWLLLLRDGPGRRTHGGLGESFRLARHPQLRLAASVHFLLFGGYLALLGLLPRLLQDGRLHAAGAGAAVASWLLAAGVANLLGPWLSDRIGLRRPFIIVGGLVAGTALFGVAFAPPSAALALLVIAALGGGSMAPLMLALPAEMEGIGPLRAGAALGLLLLVGQAGGTLLPIAAGWTAQNGGFTAALALLAAAHLLIAVPGFGLRETGRSRAPAAAVPAVAPGAP